LDREPPDNQPAPVANGSRDPDPDRFRSALRLTAPARLQAVAERLSLPGRSNRAAALVEAILDHWNQNAEAIGRGAGLSTGAQELLGLMAITESAAWPLPGASFCLSLLGANPADVLSELEALGLAVSVASPAGPSDAERRELVVHPAVIGSATVRAPQRVLPIVTGAVRQQREADGLELILRLGAFWQRLEDGPLRQTQQGSLYKRDRERLEDDPVLAGPIADALEPLPDLVPLLLALARRVGLAVEAAGGERLDPAPASYWSDNGVHLPHLLAIAWLGARDWQDLAGASTEEAPASRTLPFARPAVLLWLAQAGESSWLALDDLAEHWLRLGPALAGPILSALGPTGSPRAWLEAILLGGAYQLGLVRAAEEEPSGRRLVQLTALGRYLLTLGPYPAPPPPYPQFLFVQPNFEAIAYRQGLNPALIGQFSRFARWTKIGAALELRLTADSVYHGLEGGMTPEAMLDRLARSSARPLPPGVAEAVRTWACRRERVTYHASATLVEFPTADALEAALADWPDSARPTRVADRLLLVEDERSIPFSKFRLAGSRDYRRPVEPCVDVEDDGVTLALDLGRSDLFIDAELSRFTEELTGDRAAGPRRRFRVTRESLERGLADGLTLPALARWFEDRVGAALPPAIRILHHGTRPRPEPLRISRPIVLEVPTAELLDGLMQHPQSQPYLSRRLGPTTIAVSDAALPGLRRVLDDLGLPFEREPAEEEDRSAPESE
jgi:hypothetical protein